MYSLENEGYSLLHLPQDVFLEILSYSHGNKLSGTYKQSTVSQLFNTMIYVSKECHRRCISYVQTIPIQIPSILSKCDLMIDWMCTHRIMVGDIFCSFYKPNMASNYLRIIRECNLTKLENMRIGGGPYEESNLVDTLSKKAPALRSLYLCGAMDERRKCAILYVLSDRIETLKFVAQASRSDRNATRVPFSYAAQDEDLYDNLQEISRAIRGMKKLKRLSILPMLHRDCTFNIRSESLEYIQVLSSRRESFFVKQCICPSLKLYEGRGFDLNRNLLAGLTSMTPIKENEMKFGTCSTMGGMADDDIGAEVGVPHIDFLVSSRKFEGMEVPKSCIVRLLKCRA